MQSKESILKPSDNQTLENSGLQSKELILKPSDLQTIEKPRESQGKPRESQKKTMQSCMSGKPTETTTNITVQTNLHERKNELISKPSDHQTLEKPIQSCMSGEPTDNQTLENPGLQSKELILEPSDHQTIEKPMQSGEPIETTKTTDPKAGKERKDEWT